MHLLKFWSAFSAYESEINSNDSSQTAGANLYVLKPQELFYCRLERKI